MRSLLFFLTLLVSSFVNSQIYYHNFGTVAISGKPYTVAPTTINSNLSSSSWTTSYTAFTSLAGATGNALSLNAVSGTQTYTLSFNITAGCNVNVTSFSFWTRRSATGPTGWSMTINSISVGSGSLSGTGGVSTGTLNVSNAVNNQTTSVSLVLTLTGGTGGTFRLDDFTLNGTVLSSNSGCSTATSLSLPTTYGSTTTTGLQTTCGKINDHPVGSFGSTLYGGGQDAVWEITVPSGGGNYQFDLGGSGTYKILSLHTNCTPTSGNVLNWNTTSSGTTTSFTQNLSAGTYYLWTDTWPAPDCGQYSITVTKLAAPPPPPVNDLCSGSTLLNCATSNLAGTTVNSTSKTAPGGGGLASNYGVWYTFVGDGQQTTITTVGTSGLDQEMTIVQGTCASSTLISSQDNVGANGTESYTFVTTNGTTYYVYVAHYNSSGSSTETGTFTISRTCQAPPTPPSNDNPSGAITLIVNDPLGFLTFTNVNSTNTTTESTPTCASYTGEDVWFKVVVPAGITILDFDTQTGGITDAGMSIYRGTLGSLTEIECDDDDALDGNMSWIYREDFIPGETIYIRVWEYAGGTTGTFKIYVSTPQALPVELLNFTAGCTDEGVLITWQTASEHNSSHFTIDKSRNGIDWVKVHTEQSAGNSNQLITYNFTDKNEFSNLVYYRLNQYDFDGVYEQYGPISINCLEKTDGYFSIFPNPSFQSFNITINDETLIGDCIITIQNDMGKIVYRKNVNVTVGINLFNIVNLEVTPGVYYVNIHNETFTSNTIKQIIR